jgi:hypothetical protein
VLPYSDPFTLYVKLQHLLNLNYFSAKLTFSSTLFFISIFEGYKLLPPVNFTWRLGQGKQLVSLLFLLSEHKFDELEVV